MKFTHAMTVLLMTAPAFAQMNVVNSVSKNGVPEKCFYPEKVLGYTVDKKQIKNFEKLCDIDPYSMNSQNTDKKPALMCPKLMSSSPGLYLIENNSYLETDQFKATVCSTRRPQKTINGVEYKKLAKFKTSLGFTKAHSSVIYNYLSKMVFENLTVPEAVFRTLDYSEQRKESAFAVKQIQRLQIPKTQIIVDSWEWLNQTYSAKLPNTELKFDDTTILGILIKDFKAIQYVELAAGPSTQTETEKNSVYKNVFSEKPIIQNYSQIQKSEIQNLFESQGISEMLVIDSILSQKDRYGSYGNIHYIPYWLKISGSNLDFVKATLEDSEKRVEAAEIKEKQAEGYFLIKRISLLDNDAAIKSPKENSNIKRNVPARIRHLSQRTYSKIQNLNQLFEKSENVQEFKTAFMLKDTEMKNIETNLKSVSEILKTNCKSGFLKLDLNSEDIAAQKTNDNVCE